MNWIKQGRAMFTLAAVLAAAAPASADSPPQTPPIVAKPGEKAADRADKAEKRADKAEKIADKAENRADKAADKADKVADKAEKIADKAEKAADNAEKVADKLEDKAEEKAREARHAARKAERSTKSKLERVALRLKVEGALKGKPITPALKEELKLHARRIARLDRVKLLAEEAKDTDAAARVDKLIAKENARHDGWMSKYDPKTDAKGGAK